MIKKVSVIGAGKLGAALAFELNRKNMLSYVLARSHSKKIALSRAIEESKIISSINELQVKESDAIILAVQDSAIKELAMELASFCKSDLKEKQIIHCSGKERLSILDACKEMGASIAAAHPYQTFFKYDNEVFHQVPWLIEAEQYDEIAQFIISLNGKPFQLTDLELEKKALYHSSAVVASNLLSSTIALSKLILKEFESIAPSIIDKIVHTTDKNYLSPRNDEDFPITGPLVRGDLSTVAGHIEQLSYAPNLMKSYKAFSLATLEMLLHLNKITEENYNKAKIILEKE
ncbi:MAG: DUF2520 domain-containing protein [Ignavibacteria bacterium]|nr:DUF2520 domain-containing protein [Ignavibacteria bacterium]